MNGQNTDNSRCVIVIKSIPYRWSRWNSNEIVRNNSIGKNGGSGERISIIILSWYQDLTVLLAESVYTWHWVAGSVNPGSQATTKTSLLFMTACNAFALTLASPNFFSKSPPPVCRIPPLS